MTQIEWTRRTAALFVASATFGLTNSAFAATDFLGIPGPIRFGDMTYALAWSSNPSAGYYKHEYLPAGQSSDSFTQMVMIEVLTADITVDAAVSAQVATLNRRKQTDPVVNYAMLQHPTDGSTILDFVMSSSTGNSGIIIEWNAYRYIKHGNGIMMFAISRRSYGEQNARPFLQGLGTRRRADIRTLVEYTLPTPRRRR